MRRTTGTGHNQAGELEQQPAGQKSKVRDRFVRGLMTHGVGSLFAACVIFACGNEAAPWDPAASPSAPVAEMTAATSDPIPLIRYDTEHRCERTGCRTYHWAHVDLSRPEIFRVRTTRSEERQQTVTGFSNSVGALIATNGDWSNHNVSGAAPMGLAIGEGAQWPDGHDKADHRFIACDITNHCAFDAFNTVAAVDPAWHSAVGGNGQNLITDGIVRTEQDDSLCGSACTADAQRTAIGITLDGTWMIMMVAEGRRPGEDRGPSYSEVAEQMHALGAHNALMLDGGGSSAMTLYGTRVTALQYSATERVVRNHIGIIPVHREVTTVASNQSGTGFWLATAKGKVLPRDGAPFWGSMEGVTLNKPVVGMAATSTGEGYWLVASDGGIFAFGDAGFFGSTGAMALNAPVVGMAASPSGQGYWLFGEDGGVFAFGDAPYSGSAAGTITGNATFGTSAPGGYRVTSEFGETFYFR